MTSAAEGSSKSPSPVLGLDLSGFLEGGFQEDNKPFKVYLNYLSALGAQFEANGLDSLFLMTKTKEFQAIQPRQKDIDFSRIESCLRKAWFTEMQMHKAAAYDADIAFTNHWVCVQAYYSVYLVLQAFFISKGEEFDPSHGKILKIIAHDIKNRQNLFPLPWRIICIGSPKEESL